MQPASPYTLHWQRVEGLLAFGAGVAVVALLPEPAFSVWVMVLLFFAPDLSFAAYGVSRPFGSATYNLLHLYGTGLALFALGTALALPWLTTLGALWVAHAGFDRALGYGLKARGSFDQTHLGPIGKARRADS